MKHIALAARRVDSRAGFTLFEALAALAISAAIIGVVSQLAGLALRNWNRNSGAIATMEMLATGLKRLDNDLSLALPIRPPGSEGPTVLFSGDSTGLTFIAATGFATGNRGLELIVVRSVQDGDDMVLVRQRGPVASLAASLTDPVVLMRGRMQFRFGYRDRNAQRFDTWTNRPGLPSAVEVDIRTANGVSVFPAPVVLTLPAQLAADCLDPADDGKGKSERCRLQPLEQPASRAGQNDKGGVH